MSEPSVPLTIVDYGMGNLRSVAKAVEHVGGQAIVTGDPAAVRDARKLVLPGVGAFRDAIAHLRQARLVEPIRDHIDAGKPFLGICLGLQLLFERSYEDGVYEGLGVLPGEVVRFRFPDEPGVPSRKVPHMGWNRLDVVRRPPLLAGLPEDPSVYFVHSYYVAPRDDSVIATRTDYGGPFTSMVWRDNLFASQFHPEKSQSVGLRVLKNYVELGA